MIVVCHCTNCRKQTGPSFALVMAVPKSSVLIEGDLETFDDVGDSGHDVLRSLCLACDSPINTDVALKPDLTLISVGKLDGPSGVHPTM
jgi:hypothetical protein